MARRHRDLCRVSSGDDVALAGVRVDPGPESVDGASTRLLLLCQNLGRSLVLHHCDCGLSHRVAGDRGGSRCRERLGLHAGLSRGCACGDDADDSRFRGRWRAGYSRFFDGCRAHAVSSDAPGAAADHGTIRRSYLLLRAAVGHSSGLLRRVDVSVLADVGAVLAHEAPVLGTSASDCGHVSHPPERSCFRPRPWLARGLSLVDSPTRRVSDARASGGDIGNSVQPAHGLRVAVDRGRGHRVAYGIYRYRARVAGAVRR